MQRSFHFIFFSTLSLTSLSCLTPLSAKAQVTPDDTTSTTVNQNGNNFVIDEGDRAGDNLFHSFNEFSIPTLGSAVFNNTGDIANIFSRVTGSSISNIDGVLGANGTANLYLINPNGIIFGENARLDLGGSFFASTADSFLFEGNTEFSAVNPQAAPMLAVNIPVGARFRDNPGDIIVNGFSESENFDSIDDLITDSEPEELSNLTINNIRLIGGNISLNSANISAPGRAIFLGGLNKAGIVEINKDLSLSFPENASLSNLSLTNSTIVDITAEDGGGNITFNANNISISDGSIVTANVVGEGTGGTINITANNLSLSDSSSIRTAVEFAGNAGDIFIDVSDSIYLNKGNIFSITNAPANIVPVENNDRGAGITARDGNNNTAAVQTGEGGSQAIIIEQDGDTDITQVGGDANIPIIRNDLQDGDDSLVQIPGNINISANNIQLENNSVINADASSQNSGNINISAQEFISFRENSAISTNADILEASGGAISFVQIGRDEGSTERTPGNSGNININSGLLIASNENNDITANAFDGLGGVINITADGILGLEIREQLTFGSDITAFSQIEPSLNGQISINNASDSDPTTGLINLPASVGDASDQISQNPCQQGVGSQFIVTGKGGLPSNPAEVLNNSEIQVGLIEPIPRPRLGDRKTEVDKNKKAINNVSTKYTPAMGWVFNDEGKVTLTAYQTGDEEIERYPQQISNVCSATYTQNHNISMILH